MVQTIEVNQAMSQSHENKDVIPGLAVTNNRAIIPSGGKSMANFPSDFREVLSELLVVQSQQIVDEIPGFAKKQVNEFKSDLMTELSLSMGNILSRQIAEKMSTAEFAAAMKDVIRSGKIPIIFNQQLDLVNQIIDQRLDTFLYRYLKECEEERKTREIERRKALDYWREQKRNVWYVRASWAVACSEGWRLWLAFAVGAVLSAPLWINWPAAVGCDKKDFVCMTLRMREVKLVRKH
jgi:hypothetical protein